MRTSGRLSGSHCVLVMIRTGPQTVSPSVKILWFEGMTAHAVLSLEPEQYASAPFRSERSKVHHGTLPNNDPFCRQAPTLCKEQHMWSARRPRPL